MGRTQSRERSRTRDRQDKMTSLWPDSDNRGRMTSHGIWSSATQRPQAMVMVKTAMQKRQKDWPAAHERHLHHGAGWGWGGTVRPYMAASIPSLSCSPGQG